MTPLANGQIAKTDRPYPRRIGRLPRHLDEVTPRWLTALLRNRYPDLEVRDTRVLDIRNSHTTKLRLELDLRAGADDRMPSCVCLKSNWSDGFESGDICELEARFYHFMAGHVHAPLPRAYYADWDGDGGGRGIVVMEDLGSQPGAFGHSSDHLGVDGVARGLESLALLHGAVWGNEVLQEQRWLPRSMDTVVDTEQLRRMYRYMELNMGRPEYASRLPRWLYDAPERFSHAFDALAERERSQKGPLCLVHGDAHQGNSFLRASGQRIWHDWQLVRKGRPSRDITYFMIGALTIDERRRSERDLLQHYREALLATGAQEVPATEALWDDYRRWPVYGMQAWLANVDLWGQGGLPMVERFFVAAEDLQTIELLTREATVPPGTRKLGEGARAVTPAILDAYRKL